uniref:ADAM metallopeptidase with thrombospondin type 1 motif, 9 n=1 Tax=Astyanax mexicanus TaxID=7994 RepID=A0A8B9LKD8_ASTMX
KLYKHDLVFLHFSAYEIVTPARVDEAGEPLPASAHFKRKRRSVDAPTEHEHWSTERVHYRIAAFGQDYRLNLTLDSGFLAPAYSVTVLGLGGGRNFTEEEEEEEEETAYQHCFYRGHVNAHAEHAAVISLCSGLLGTFRSSEGEYFVEPLHSYNGEDYAEEHIKPHIVYRKDAQHQMQSAKEDSSPCDSSGKTVQCLEIGTFLLFFFGVSQEYYIKKYQKLTHIEHRPHRRSKRFLSYPRFVEVMVVADSKMVEHHGSSLQHYILTLMSIVSSIYKDPSIGNLINIVVVKLVIINNELEGPVISFNAQSTLKNFCIWQQGQNHLDDNHHSHHDTAILITRQDICRARDKCDTLGLAELGTVCDPYRSCSISEDNGLSTAFTIAHELGHVFNMPHDDSNKCKEDGVKNQQHVMAPTLNYYTNPWMWSKCSRKYITEFLDTGYGECLLDEPVSRPYPLPQQQPGRIYNVNKQCELIFGPGTQVCPYMTQCRRLWCTSPEGAQRGCRTQHMPWADGTDCAPGKHCKHGLCIPKEHDSTPVEGAWGVWSPFGSCSRTCGGGIKIAVRDCNRPLPRNGGKYCVGRRMKFRSCNSEPCSKQNKDFREEQCATFDGRHFNINGLPPNVRWVPKYSGILMKDRCKLFCRVSGSTAYYQLRDRVIDGTPCGPDTNDICVQGLCRQAGCDHVLNSKARRDKCGVCGGDNSSCKTVAGTFNTVNYGYNVVVRIPSGATNIDVRQHSFSGKPEDDNYLGDRGDYLLNGDFVVSMFKREIKVGNAVIEYSGSDHVIERLNCTDRIEEEIIVQVLSVGNLYNPDVRYSYNIPIEDKSQQFIWDAYGPWQECSRLCQGERKRKILCSRESDRVVVSDQRCHGSPRPAAITEQCNTDCELRWHIARKSECTAICGIGYRTLEIYCAKNSRSDSKTQKVDDRYCSNQRKPDDKEVCHGDCSPGGWEYSPWSECSKSCGGGTQRRSAVCGKSAEGNADESKCNSRDKLTVQPCNEFLCPQWKTGEWSECLVTCGKGYKHRQTWCQFGEDRLDDRFCDSSKPESVQACQQQECASWQVGPWGQCTTSCGPGYQLRAVKCVVGSYGAVMDDTECNAATRPTHTQVREITKMVPHPGHKTQWRYGSWTQCSATCGKGTRMRYVSCRDNQGGVAEDSSCAHLPKPPAREVCSVGACGQWKALEWSQCSVSCGQGKATRQVLCVNFSDQDQVVDMSECDPDDRPATEQECNMAQCPSRSSDHGGFPPNSDARKRTPSSGRADRIRGGRSHQWRTGPWGAVSCSKPCGGGIKTRLVACQRPNGERFNDLSCEIFVKPSDQEQCNTQSCSANPHWSTDPWSSCSASCGRGYRYRNVTCVGRSGQPIAEENCRHVSRPQKQRRCRGGRCPKWKTSAWGECSASCGAGEQRREVFCQIGDQRRVPDSECSHLPRPPSTQTCSREECPARYRWSQTEWQTVSDIMMKRETERERERESVRGVCVRENKRESKREKESKRKYIKEIERNKFMTKIALLGFMNRLFKHVSRLNQYVLTPCSLSGHLASSCRDVQLQTGVVTDGEQVLSVQGKALKIYCSEMDTDSPKEYITLTTGEHENFSEVFGFRLMDPTQCPTNLSTREDCHCRRDYTAAGLSTFTRVRLDLSKMTIITTDWTYAFTHEGHKVPFATAGDCYSAARCPQGRFRINLSGTGFQVAESTKWISQGNYAVADIHKSVVRSFCLSIHPSIHLSTQWFCLSSHPNVSVRPSVR